MPSYKPKVQILLSTEYHKKFKKLCEKERRSDSIMGAIMIEKYIDDYEKINGEITIENSNNQEKQAIKIIKDITGVSLGEAIADKTIDIIKTHK